MGDEMIVTVEELKTMFMIYDEVFDMAENEGLVRGYVTLSELDEAIHSQTMCKW